MKRPIQPRALNCPNCGGAVMSDRTQCEFCRSRLKTVGCAACLGLMFLGAKFCTNCGAKATAAVVIEEKDAGDCPRCKIPLQLLEIDTVSIRECNRCGGFWSDTATFEALCANNEKQSSVLGFIGSDAHPQNHPDAISYVPCPDCSQLMNRSNFARSSGIIIDICRDHGVWFDADELPKIFAFIRSGGMSRQREKKRISIEERCARLKDKQRRMSALSRRTGTAGYEDAPENTPIGGIIGRLLGL